MRDWQILFFQTWLALLLWCGGFGSCAGPSCAGLSCSGQEWTSEWGEPRGESLGHTHTTPVFEQFPVEPAEKLIADDVLPYSETVAGWEQDSPERFTNQGRVTNQRRGPLGEDRSPIRVNWSWIPPQEVRGGGGELSLLGMQASLAFPLRIAPDGSDFWLAITSLDHLQISTSASLPDSRIPVPDELWKINVGTMHIREFDDWRVGGLLTVGTASDQPFAGIRDMTVTALAFLNIPHGPRDAWSFSLFYSPTSQLPFPIPGIAYVWRPSEQFTANIGIPFSLDYQPTESFTMSASYRPLTNVTFRASQRVATNWKLFAGYQVVNETYWLSERENHNERLYLFDQRCACGLERDLAFGFRLELAAAYVFDRRIFQAESFSDNRRDVLRIESGPAANFVISWSR